MPVGVDEVLLLQHRRYESSSLGLSEEFHQVELGLGRTVAVLSRPLTTPHSVGWVICHSFGIEQVHLSRFDVIVSRALSNAGFPVLRYHGQGYGDSELGLEVTGLRSHLEEALDAVAWMAAQEGVLQVGILGARFGGAVAALAASRLQLPFTILWEPVVRGSQYIRDMLRSLGLGEIAGGLNVDVASEIERGRKELSERGWIDINGMPLSQGSHDEISALDLTKDLTRWEGAVLLGGASRTGKPSSGLVKFSQHLESIGAQLKLEVLADPFASGFGQFRFHTIDGGTAKKDTQLRLNQAMAAASVEWSLSQAGLPTREEVST